MFFCFPLATVKYQARISFLLQTKLHRFAIRIFQSRILIKYLNSLSHYLKAHSTEWVQSQHYHCDFLEHVWMGPELGGHHCIGYYAYLTVRLSKNWTFSCLRDGKSCLSLYLQWLVDCLVSSKCFCVFLNVNKF